MPTPRTRTPWARFGRSTARLFVLRVAGIGALFGMHAVLARQLGAGGYGVVSYALATAGFGALLACLGLHNGVLRFAAQYLELARWPELKGVLLRSGQIVLGASFAVAVALGTASLVPALDPSLQQSLRFGALALPLVAFGLWRVNAARGLGATAAAYAPEEILLPGLVIAAVAGLAVSRPEPAMLSWLLVAGATSVVGLAWLVRTVPAAARAAAPVFETRHWLAVSLPMTVASLTQLSLSRTDTLLVGALTSMEEAGRYVAASRIALLAALALRIVDTAAAPMMSAAYHGGRRRELAGIFWASSALSLLGALPFAAAAWIAPDELMRLFGGQFVEAAPLLQVLVLGQLINAATGPIGFLLLMTGHERPYARAVAVTASIAAICLAMVIPRWGSLGAAWVSAVSIGALNLASLAYGVAKVLLPGGKPPAASIGAESVPPAGTT